MAAFKVASNQPHVRFRPIADISGSAYDRRKADTP